MFLNSQSAKHKDRSEDGLPSEIQGLLKTYRHAVEIPEASIEFMPKLWERIDRQQKITYGFRRLASRFVTAAAGICLLMSLATFNGSGLSTSHAGTYVDILSDDASDDTPGDSVSTL